MLIRLRLRVLDLAYQVKVLIEQISPCRIRSTDLQLLKLGLGLSSSEMTLKLDDTIQERFVSLACQVGTDMALNDPCFVFVQPPLKVLPTKESTNSRLKR